MMHNEGNFKDARNSNIYFQNWLPEGEIKASIIVVHGLAEHSGRYMNIVNYFVPSGYAVHAIDHFGHGKSDGPRVFIDKFNDYTDSLAAYTKAVTTQYGNRPLFLIGHSMGGLIAASYLIERQGDFTGAILSGPLIRPRDHVPAVFSILVAFLSAVLPRLRIVGLNAQYVSRDPQVVKSYIDDPLVFNGKITSRLASELSKAMNAVSTKAHKINLPLLIVQGGADKLVDPKETKKLYDMVRSTDKTIRVFDNLFHEIFNEPENSDVLKHVIEWTDARLPATK